MTNFKQKHQAAETTTYSFIFIPDISGFTSFVRQTEVVHSKHIVEELLEVIIDNNELGLEISEIEGDAVLFYQYQNTPDYAQIIKLTQKTFIAFHQHLKRYERDRICQCGACSTAINLSLKFVAYLGEIDFLQVKNHRKPYGTGVILAHRLLKNNLKMNEYLLLAGHFSDLFTNDRSPLKNGGIMVENIGYVKFRYLELSYLHDQVPEPPPLQTSENTQFNEQVNINIEQTPERVFEVISQLEYRARWINDIKKVDFDQRKMNRAGTRHVCVFDKKEIAFEALKNYHANESLVYAEQVLNPPFIKTLRFYYFVSERDNHSKITLQAHFEPNNWLGWLLMPFVRDKIRKSLLSSAAGIKMVSENIDDLQLQFGK